MASVPTGSSGPAPHQSVCCVTGTALARSVECRDVQSCVHLACDGRVVAKRDDCQHAVLEDNVLGKGSTSCRRCGASRFSSRVGCHEERCWFRRASIRCARDHARSLLDPENVRVEHEIVVRRRFLIDAVETLQVVAARGIGVLDLASRLVGVDPL